MEDGFVVDITDTASKLGIPARLSGAFGWESRCRRINAFRF
jgi:hypothetical protein